MLLLWSDLYGFNRWINNEILTWTLQKKKHFFFWGGGRILSVGIGNIVATLFLCNILRYNLSFHAINLSLTEVCDGVTKM